MPQPLYRYASTDPDVVDGGLFGLVTSAGTDLEALLVIEARRSSGSSGLVWHRAAARFTDQELRMRHKGKEFFQAAIFLYDKPYPDPERRHRSSPTGIYHRSTRSRESSWQSDDAYAGNQGDARAFGMKAGAAEAVVAEAKWRHTVTRFE